MHSNTLLVVVVVDVVVASIVVFFLGACKMMVGCKVQGGGSGSDSQRKL